MTELAPLRAALVEMAPLLRRVADLDSGTLARIRTTPDRVTLFARLPFRVLAGRTLAADGLPPLDRTVLAGELLGWLDGERAAEPEPRDAQWRGAAPPADGWQRVDTVPDDVIRGLVRSGALALKEAGGSFGVQPPRASDALLDAIVLTAEDGANEARLSLRALSALTRMGFLPRGSQAAIDISGRWVRVAAAYGSIFVEPQGGVLDLLR